MPQIALVKIMKLYIVSVRNKLLKPILQKEFCADTGFVFYASNEDIIEKFEINHLVKIPVQLTDKNF